jgi:hypothetical protein
MASSKCPIPLLCIFKRSRADAASAACCSRVPGDSRDATDTRLVVADAGADERGRLSGAWRSSASKVGEDGDPGRTNIRVRGESGPGGARTFAVAAAASASAFASAAAAAASADVSTVAYDIDCVFLPSAKSIMPSSLS